MVGILHSAHVRIGIIRVILIDPFNKLDIVAAFKADVGLFRAGNKFIARRRLRTSSDMYSATALPKAGCRSL